MPTIEQRLHRVETKFGIGREPARVIFLRGGRAHEDRIPAFLASHGIHGMDSDLVVFHTIYEARDGVEADEPLELVSVTPMTGGRHLK